MRQDIREILRVRQDVRGRAVEVGCKRESETGHQKDPDRTSGRMRQGRLSEETRLSVRERESKTGRQEERDRTHNFISIKDTQYLFTCRGQCVWIGRQGAKIF